jgi:hypothetical protein
LSGLEFANHGSPYHKSGAAGPVSFTRPGRSSTEVGN